MTAFPLPPLPSMIGPPSYSQRATTATAITTTSNMSGNNINGNSPPLIEVDQINSNSTANNNAAISSSGSSNENLNGSTPSNSISTNINNNSNSNTASSTGNSGPSQQTNIPNNNNINSINELKHHHQHILQSESTIVVQRKSSDCYCRKLNEKKSKLRSSSKLRRSWRLSEDAELTAQLAQVIPNKNNNNSNSSSGKQQRNTTPYLLEPSRCDDSHSQCSDDNNNSNHSNHNHNHQNSIVTPPSHHSPYTCGFIAREAEFKLLTDKVEEFLNNPGNSVKAIKVKGEYGCGKSFLGIDHPLDSSSFPLSVLLPISI